MLIWKKSETKRQWITSATLAPQDAPCHQAVYFVLPAGIAVGCGVALSYTCVIDLLVMLPVQLALVLLWSFRKKPMLGITWLYVLVCVVLLAKETAVVYSGRYPCGLQTFGSTCSEMACDAYDYVLWMRAGCLRWSCVRVEEAMTQVYELPRAELQTSWMICGLACVWITIGVSIWHLSSWRAATLGAKPKHDMVGHNLVDEVPLYVTVVLATPATYGLCAAYGLRTITATSDEGWDAEAMLDVAQMFSAISLLAFQRLLVAYVSIIAPSESDLMGLALEDAASLSRTNSAKQRLSAFRGSAQAMAELNMHVRHSFRRLVEFGVYQYVLLQALVNVLQMLGKIYAWWSPDSCETTLQSLVTSWLPEYDISLHMNITAADGLHKPASALACEDVWVAVSVVATVADFFTCGIALVAILAYEHAFQDVLNSERPLWKFWGVKGLLSVNFSQKLCIVAGCSLLDRHSSVGEQLRRLRPFLNYFLLCVEVVLLACLNVWAYPAHVGTPFAKDSELEMGDTLHWRMRD